jgi:MEDS: MEthanogen/methylotroph, DcmR Sensory domain
LPAAKSCGRNCREKRRITDVRRHFRVSGADALQPHDHVVWYGEREDDLYALASAALAASARRNERLMLVASEPDPAQLVGIDDLDALLDRGQLDLVDVESVYGSWDTFDAAKQLATFEGVLADALADGYTGIRVVADNTSLACGDDVGFRRWLQWEQVTDRFQSQSNVTGICYFDRSALSAERQADLASLHPVCSASAVEPPFSFFVDGDAVSVTGTLDAWSVDQFTRILSTAPAAEPLVVDLSHAEFVDHRAVLALNAAASASRPVRIRRAPEIISKLPSLLSLSTPHLCFE